MVEREREQSGRAKQQEGSRTWRETLVQDRSRETVGGGKQQERRNRLLAAGERRAPLHCLAKVGLEYSET